MVIDDPRTRLAHKLVAMLRHNMNEAEKLFGKRELVLTDQDLDILERWPDEVLQIEAVAQTELR